MAIELRQSRISRGYVSPSSPSSPRLSKPSNKLEPQSRGDKMRAGMFTLTADGVAFGVDDREDEK
jgi:hypothetical protein